MPPRKTVRESGQFTTNLALALRILALLILLVGGAIFLLNQQKPFAQVPVTSTTRPIVIPQTAQGKGTHDLYGLPRDQTLVLLSGESNNPRTYDPATGHGDDLIFSGLVSFNPQMQLTPDLASSWDIDGSGTVYTFHLRTNAYFHDGRPVTASDVIYSWNRAADPAIGSNTVLTYLGDIAGIQDRAAGKTKSISGLQAVDDHTLKVTLDAPKPYFLMKLTYGTALVVDRANVESGPDWYKRPNGTGPYKLQRWEAGKVVIYERNEHFYLPPPAIRYIVYQLYAGLDIRLYETGDIDISGVSIYDIARVQDPADPLHNDLLTGVNTCTSYVVLDSTQPPFDDPQVRQAFSLAVNRNQYIDVALRGRALPAHGLYPPALPGYNAQLGELQFNPEQARQRLAGSKYAKKTPTVILTVSGFGSNVSIVAESLVGMWEKNLGITVQVENIEPDKYSDMVYSGQHGQLVLYGWCADYLDPENFADALFHSNAKVNLGHYSNPALDTLLNQARVERNVSTRIQMYQHAEQILIEDSAAIFLAHSIGAVVVKPYVKGYVWTPVSIPIVRYLSIDASKLPG